VATVSKLVADWHTVTDLHSTNDRWQLLTLIFLPGRLLTSCSAMSSQISGFSPEALISASFSQSLLAVWAYVPDGDAWVIRVVVTTPVDLPASLGANTQVPLIRVYHRTTNIKNTQVPLLTGQHRTTNIKHTSSVTHRSPQNHKHKTRKFRYSQVNTESQT
jgi:hypothetical protein